MAIMTYEAQLEEVQAAITTITTMGQNYTIDNRSLGRADLGKLVQRENWLRGMAAREARGGGIRQRYGTAT